MTFPDLSRNVASLAGAARIAIAAHAQPVALSPPAGDEPVVETFELEQVAELNPGVALHFSVFGTADAIVTLRSRAASTSSTCPRPSQGSTRACT